MLEDIGLVKSIKGNKVCIMLGENYVAAIDSKQLKEFLKDDNTSYTKFENLK